MLPVNVADRWRRTDQYCSHQILTPTSEKGERIMGGDLETLTLRPRDFGMFLWSLLPIQQQINTRGETSSMWRETRVIRLNVKCCLMEASCISFHCRLGICVNMTYGPGSYSLVTGHSSCKSDTLSRASSAASCKDGKGQRSCRVINITLTHVTPEQRGISAGLSSATVMSCKCNRLDFAWVRK